MGEVEVADIVVCEECGILYDFRLAGGKCPVCGSEKHKGLGIALSLISVFEAKSFETESSD